MHCFRKDLQVAACRALTQWVEKISEIFRVWTRQLKGLKLQTLLLCAYCNTLRTGGT